MMKECLECIFYYICFMNVLRAFPDISKYKTVNVSHMKNMFIESILKLPDFFILKYYLNLYSD